jgi:hypothetical protein
VAHLLIGKNSNKPTWRYAVNKAFDFAEFDDIFLQSSDDFEPYGLVAPESLLPVDVETAWNSEPPSSRHPLDEL